ncbi:hypothetical protein KSW85_14680, partial [Prevotella copri]|uniref:hypothetical protein n=1 Tax=Segatella copri TaxID=165179 RepID=UPI001C3945B5
KSRMLNYHNPKRDFFSVLPCRRDGEVEKSALRAVTFSLFGQERGLVRDVEPSLMVKKDGMILEGNHLNIFRKAPFF